MRRLAGRSAGIRLVGGGALDESALQAEAKELVVAGAPHAVRAQLGKALDVVGAPRRVMRPAPQAIERGAKGHLTTGWVPDQRLGSPPEPAGLLRVRPV